MKTEFFDRKTIRTEGPVTDATDGVRPRQIADRMEAEV